MPKIVKSLGPLAVSRLTVAGLHAVGEVPGLCLQVTETGARTWVLRATVGTKRREIGLGGYPAVTLSDARTSARRMREKIRAGVDPVEEARAARSAMLAAQVTGQTFKQCAEAYIKAMAPQWRSGKHRQQWENTLTQYAYPVLGDLLVRHVAQEHVIRVFEQPAAPAAPSGPSLWAGKTETATRLRGRIEAVLDWAKVRG
ncbi:tyrosine-type recombinase/integrase, partial [Ideonella sp.]|uniref:tyrosine-type recombinase/integrase n=1 Tax=Ideonella sp. TaxID=1929293 RepID=UPI003BB723DC